LKPITSYLILFCLWINFECVGQTRVGLVLSGGGASGLAHVGVLKALEERGIPIDYITGTSAGALVGSMYASGYSPEEIERYILSDDFLVMSTGKLKSTQHFLYRDEETDAGMFSFPFSKDSLLTKSLPTKFVSSAYLDFEMMRLLGSTGASHSEKFDSLFVPFRCVASDITHKKSVVFESGNLNQAVRASIAYPFYFDPIRIDNVLLFDGGLYNNFPANVMYKAFNPDFIIGSNVSNNAAAPTEDDLISQLTNMLVSHSDFNLPCKAGLIIEPNVDISTFDFEHAKKAIDIGYTTTLAYLDSIVKQINRVVPKAEVERRRAVFRTKTISINVSSVTSNLKGRINVPYVQKLMIFSKRNEIISLETLEKRYFRLYAMPQLDLVFPTLSIKRDSTYNLHLNIRKSKDFKLDVGGHLSSRSVNTGYIGLTYRNVLNTASSLHASSYFGKFYGSIKLAYTIEFPSILPLSSSIYLTMNRWDYFRSFATFFEDVKPSFLIQNELYYGIKINNPIGNTTKSTLDFRVFRLEDDYYQTSNFTSKDTSDITHFNGSTCSWEYLKNSLNRKQFANSGHFFRFKARYVNGFEKTIPGSTSAVKLITEKFHEWANINAEFQSFFIDHRVIHLAVHAKGVFNSQSLFSNYTATLLSMTSFSLIPDAETYFLPEYRSSQYVGGGLNAVLSLRKRLDMRLDAYYYQPFVALQKNNNGTASYSKPFKGDSYMASLSLIYFTFMGPLRATINYFPKQANPLVFQISYGYVLFNERAIR
jgi:NTE family protein